MSLSAILARGRELAANLDIEGDKMRAGYVRDLCDALDISPTILARVRRFTPGYAEDASPAYMIVALCERIEALQSGAGILEAFDAGAAQAREPTVGTRLVGYRAAALSAIAGTKIDDGGKTAERRTAEACERYAHAMLAAERAPEAAPAPLPGLSVDDRAVLAETRAALLRDGTGRAWAAADRIMLAAVLAKVLGEDDAPTVATCARCGALPDASAGVVLVPGMAAAGLRRGYVCEDVHACAERQEAP